MSQDPSEKQRYTISELAGLYSVTARAIRFYEDKGILAPSRKGQARFYSERDRVRLGFVVRGKRVGFALADIKELLDLYDQQNGPLRQKRAAIDRFRDHIGQLEAQRNDINEAISEIGGWVATLEKDLAAGGSDQNKDPPA